MKLLIGLGSKNKDRNIPVCCSTPFEKVLLAKPQTYE